MLLKTVHGSLCCGNIGRDSALLSWFSFFMSFEAGAFNKLNNDCQSALLGGVKGNWVEIPSDPVTVNREQNCRMPLSDG